jgi:hypothetical protein
VPKSSEKYIKVDAKGILNDDVYSNSYGFGNCNYDFMFIDSKMGKGSYRPGHYDTPDFNYEWAYAEEQGTKMIVDRHVINIFQGHDLSHLLGKTLEGFDKKMVYRIISIVGSTGVMEGWSRRSQDKPITPGIRYLPFSIPSYAKPAHVTKPDDSI